MNMIEKKEIDNLVDRILLKYRDKLNVEEKENFKTFIYNKKISHEELEKILRDLLLVNEEQFMAVMKSCGVILNVSENKVEVIDVENNVSIAEPVVNVDDNFTVETPNANMLSESEMNTPLDEQKVKKITILPNSIRGYVDVTLLVIILNAVCSLALWIMLTILYNV